MVKVEGIFYFKNGLVLEGYDDVIAATPMDAVNSLMKDLDQHIDGMFKSETYGFGGIMAFISQLQAVSFIPVDGMEEYADE